MVKRNIIKICFSVFIYILAILVVALIPVQISNEKLLPYDDYILNYFLSTLFSLISCNLIFFGSKKISKLIMYLVSFFMIYVALIIGGKFIFELVLNKLLRYYESNTLINTEGYEKLYSLWTNDLSRNFIFLTGLIFSAIFSGINLLIVTLFCKYKKHNKENIEYDKTQKSLQDGEIATEKNTD